LSKEGDLPTFALDKLALRAISLLHIAFLRHFPQRHCNEPFLCAIFQVTSDESKLASHAISSPNSRNQKGISALLLGSIQHSELLPVHEAKLSQRNIRKYEFAFLYPGDYYATIWQLEYVFSH
jgi:hypothetical protein